MIVSADAEILSVKTQSPFLIKNAQQDSIRRKK